MLWETQSLMRSGGARESDVLLTAMSALFVVPALDFVMLAVP
jgi:hypothetical protein